MASGDSRSRNATGQGRRTLGCQVSACSPEKGRVLFVLSRSFRGQACFATLYFQWGRRSGRISVRYGDATWPFGKNSCVFFRNQYLRRQCGLCRS